MIGILAEICFMFVIISPFLSFNDFLGYWDEILCLTCIGFSLVRFLKKPIIHKNLLTSRIIMLSIIMVIIGICGNLLFINQSSLEAIFRDIVGFLKFPMILCTVYNSRFPDLIIKKKKNILRFVNILIWLILVLGVISLFRDIGMSQVEIRHGIRPYMFLANHPTSLVTVMVMLLGIVSMYESYSSRSAFVQYIVISLIIVFTMRTKGLVLIAGFWFLKYSHNWARRFKITYWILVAGVIFAATYSKLAIVASWSGSGRADLYFGSFNLMKVYFPIGSGFGTYASHLSGRYLSKVYSFINVREIFTFWGKATAVLGDTGYPYYFGQFGVLGTTIFALLFYYLFRLSYDTRKGYLCALTILMYIMIALTSESILLNSGAELAVVMGICAKYVGNNKVVSRKKPICSEHKEKGKIIL